MCILFLLYFTELVVSIVDFVFLLYLESTGDFCTLWYLVYFYLEMQRGILKMYRGIFFLNLFIIHDIFIVYFFVMRILFCVVDRISASLLFN